MAGTIIDTLTVILGLDPKQFKKGTKEAEDATKNATTVVTKSAGEMVGALQRVAAEFVALFLTVRGIHDVVDMFTELNAGVRQLGVDSRNTGESAAHLRDYGNLAEMAGGKAEDALATIQSLQQSVFNAHEGYGYDDQLKSFGRIGVGDIGQSTGKLQDFHDILLRTATALQQLDKPERYQWTQKAGLQGGIANAVVEGPQVLEKYWQQQLKIHQTTQGDTDAAIKLGQAWDLLKDKMRALATQILTAVSPAVQKLLLAFGNFATKHQKDIDQGVQTIADWATGPGPGEFIEAITQMADAAVDTAKQLHDVADGVLHPLRSVGKLIGAGYDNAHTAAINSRTEFDTDAEARAAEKKYGLPKGILDWVGMPSHQARGVSDPLAQQLKKQHDDSGGDAKDPNWFRTANDFNKAFRAAQDIPPAADATKANQGAGASPRAAGAISGATPSGPPTGRNQVSVTLGDIYVTSGATNASELADNLAMQLQRKLTTTLADTALS